MASNILNNNINIMENEAITNTTVIVQEKSNVTQEEQDNFNNMNVNCQHKSTTHADTKSVEINEQSNINNNHVNEVVSTANNNHVAEVVSKKDEHVSNNLNNQGNGNSTSVESNGASAIRDCDIDVSMQNNALSDLMNTYSSDEDMFENFRSKPEFDEHKSEDECLSSSTSFLSLNDSENSSAEEEPIAPKKSQGVKMKSTRNKGELDLGDLPPIEDLQISVPEDQCLPVGKILNIVDTLVLIKTLKNTPTLDLDSVLFLDKGQRSLGKIFDVIGPVSGPVYCVRFNSHQHIVDSNIKIDQDVYCAPQTEHTSYVPLPDLIKVKGSDASWERDQEPPPEVVEFSDDEEERKVKRNQLRTRNNRNTSSADGTDPPDVPPEPKTRRPTPFEQRMNLRNLLMTASYERRNRINDTATTSRPANKSFTPGSIIRAPTLPDIPPLPLPMSQPSAPPPRFTPPQHQHQQETPRPPPQHLTSPPPPLGVFSPPPLSPVCTPLFHQNKKRPSTASPFSHPPRFSSPFSPPMFTSLPPPPPLFNDMLVFSPPGVPPYLPHPPHPYTPTPPPFQFGMPPLLGARVPPTPRYRHNPPPRPPCMMRPAFGTRHRF